MLVSYSLMKAQSVTNGNFSSGTTGWGCKPETNAQSVYGGTGSNAVAEIDSDAGLCQTISGFTIGSVYRLSLSYCRRTASDCPSPNPARGVITISNGALTASVSSNATTFSLQPSVFTFTATQTTHTLTIAANFASYNTCGLLIDDVSIILYSGLPVELLSFEALANDQEDLVLWSTASEINNRFFSIERSDDAIRWQTLKTVDAAGTSTQAHHYTTTIEDPLPGIAYYRLKQVDYDRSFSYSSIAYVEREPQALSVFPNPAMDELTVQSNRPLTKLELVSVMGQVVLSESISGTQHELDLSGLSPGVYFVNIYSINQKVVGKKLVVQK